MRQIVLDTETTGLEPKQGHRIIEIGCVEVDSRRLTGRDYHQYLQPDREIDEGAIQVHGITNEFLADKPRMADVIGDFIEFVRGAELIIHNAPLDVGFINHELAMLGPEWGTIEAHCQLHGALLDARILADVYLMMTGGQTMLSLGAENDAGPSAGGGIRRLSTDRPSLRVLRASESELDAHADRLAAIEKASGNCLWKS